MLFLLCLLTFVSSQYETSFMSPLWCHSLEVAPRFLENLSTPNYTLKVETIGSNICL